MSPERWLTPIDRRLLRALLIAPSVVEAARRTRIGRDRAVYRLKRMRRLYGGPVVTGRRGRSVDRATTLTALGRRLVDEPRGALARSANRWRGLYRRGADPTVELEGGGRLVVAFRARESARVEVEVDPSAIIVGRAQVALSARNVLPVTVVGIRRGPGGPELKARWLGHTVRVAITEGSVGRLRLRAGARAYLYVKAYAIRRATRGSLRP